MSGYLDGPGWRYVDFFALFLAMIAGAFVGAIVLFVVVPGEASGTEQLAYLAGGQFIGAFGFMIVYSRRRASGRLGADYGLVLRLEDIWALFLGIGSALTLALVVALAFEWLGIDPEEQGVVELVRDSPGVVGVVVVVLVVVVAAPIVEEILFRGVLLAVLMRRFSRTPAVVLSAAAFALSHLTDPDAVFAIPALFALGLVFGYLAISTGDLSRAIFAHMGVNALAVVQLFLF
ncbi:MAG: CPBP family intramembrane metalloprotease [Acidimicrobiia bacterium]|nr:CPBP family intramembrane metalloprotease [Acidimicrobiia bacterium]